MVYNEISRTFKTLVSRIQKAVFYLLPNLSSIPRNLHLKGRATVPLTVPRRGERAGGVTGGQRRGEEKTPKYEEGGLVLTDDAGAEAHLQKY